MVSTPEDCTQYILEIIGHYSKYDHDKNADSYLHSTSGSAGNTATAVVAGMYHTCALRSDGTIVCWGYNGHGQLGRVGAVTSGQTAGSMGSALVPVDIGAGTLTVLALVFSPK